MLPLLRSSARGARRLRLRREMAVRASSSGTLPPAPSGDNMEGIDEELLGLLGCPLSKEPLEYDDATNELRSNKVGVAYPVRNGIPVLIPTEGRVLAGGGSDDNATDGTRTSA